MQYLLHSDQPRWLSGLKRSRVHSLMIARRSLCPEKLGFNPGQGSEGINFSGWHGLDMSVTVTTRRYTPTNQTNLLHSMKIYIKMYKIKSNKYIFPVVVLTEGIQMLNTWVVGKLSFQL